MQKEAMNKFFEHRLPNEKAALISSFGEISILSREQLQEVKQGNLGIALKQKLEQDMLLLTPKNREKVAEKTRQRYRHLFEGVTLHIINPTLRCNMACRYCYANTLPLKSRRPASDLDLETAKKILDFIWQSPAKRITIEFQGGEPLANFPAIEFMVENAEKRKGKEVHFRLVSNFTLMDSTIALFLKKHRVLDLCTSLDGPKKLHDKNRKFGGGGSYSQVVRWISALKKDYGFSHIGMLPTITKHSLPFPSEIVDEYASHGMQDIIPVMLRKIGRAKQNWERIGYSAEQYISFWKQLAEYCIKLTRQGKPMAEQYCALTLQKILGNNPNHTCFSKPCGAGLMQASYQPNGDIYACDESKAEPLFRLGSVSQSYPAVFTSPAALNIVALSSTLGFLCNECKWSPFCRFCPMLAYSSQGSLVPILPKDMDCKVKKAQISFAFEKLFSKDRPIMLRWAGKAKT